MTFLPSPAQVGSPPTTDPDASIGFSCSVATGFCESEKFALFFFGGNRLPGPLGKESDLARRAKVGYCPRCGRATHGAITPTCASGEHHAPKARGLSLSGRLGSRAPRRLPAFHCAKSLGGCPPSCLPSGTDFRARPWPSLLATGATFCAYAPLRLNPRLRHRRRAVRLELRVYVATQHFLSHACRLIPSLRTCPRARPPFPRKWEASNRCKALTIIASVFEEIALIAVGSPR